MTQDELKQQAALRALDYVIEGAIVGVGTGSTANFFIDGLATMKDRIAGAVASSEVSARRLAGHGIRLLDMNDVDDLPVYIDGADEINASLAMIKGGGGAQTREKIVAAVARKFVCIGGATGALSPSGRGHSHGPRTSRQGTHPVGWPAGAARGLHYRQWQPDP